jgi:hypothetical protein
MLLKVIDAQGNPQTIVTAAQEAVVDHSGTITTTGLSQLLLAPNALRSGWCLQNTGTSVLWCNPLGGDAVAGAGSLSVPVGGMFPPAGFPLTAAQINVIGTAGSSFTALEW